MVDTDTKPTCASAKGVSLGTITAKPPRTVQQAPWRVTENPVTILGRVVGRRIQLVTIRNAPSLAQRVAESLSTIEVARFDPASTAMVSTTAAKPSREAVFALLPSIASAAPGAVVRTARLFNGYDIPRGFVYGAQVRDANISAEQRTAVLAESKRLGIPVSIVSTPARPIAAACPELPDGNPPDHGEVTATEAVAPGSTPAWTGTLNGWPAAPTGCDEPTQVFIVRRTIVGPISNKDGTDRPDVGVDLVIDASLRLSSA